MYVGAMFRCAGSNIHAELIVCYAAMKPKSGVVEKSRDVFFEAPFP